MLALLIWLIVKFTLPCSSSSSWHLAYNILRITVIWVLSAIYESYCIKWVTAPFRCPCWNVMHALCLHCLYNQTDMSWWLWEKKSRCFIKTLWEQLLHYCSSCCWNLTKWCQIFDVRDSNEGIRISVAKYPDELNMYEWIIIVRTHPIRHLKAHDT